MLELVNGARANPGATIDRLTAKLDDQTVNTLSYYRTNLQTEKNAISAVSARSPLAWSDKLADAATAHSQDQASKGFQSHTGSDGSSSGDRIARTGFEASASTENAYAYSGSVDDAMRAFLIDWGVAKQEGHRNNLLQTNPSDKNFDSIGFGLVKSSKPGFGPLVVTPGHCPQRLRQQGANPGRRLWTIRTGTISTPPAKVPANVTIKGPETSPRARSLRSRPGTRAATKSHSLPAPTGFRPPTGRPCLGRNPVQVKSSNVKVDFRVDQAGGPAQLPPDPRGRDQAHPGAGGRPGHCTRP